MVSAYGPNASYIRQETDVALVDVQAAEETTVPITTAAKRKAAGAAFEKPKRSRKATAATPALVDEKSSQGTADHVPLTVRKTTKTKKSSKVPVAATQSFVEAYLSSKTTSQIAASEPSLGEASVQAKETLSPAKEAENIVGGQDDTNVSENEGSGDDLMIIEHDQVMEVPENVPAELSKETAAVSPAEVEPTVQNIIAEPASAATNLPAPTKSQQSSSATNSSKIKKKSESKAESISAAKPSSSTQTLAAGLKVNLPTGFDYNLDDFDFDDEEVGDDQTLKEAFPDLAQEDTPEVVQAKGVVRQVFSSSSFPAMGDEMDTFQGALKCLQKSFSPDAEDSKKISILLAEIPKLAIKMNDNAKTLKISSSVLAEVQAKDAALKAKKEYLAELSGKSKAGQAKVDELNKTLEDLKTRVKQVEDELKTYDHLAERKAKCDSAFLECVQLSKELKKKQALVPDVEKKKKEAEAAAVAFQDEWNALVKNNSFCL